MAISGGIKLFNNSLCLLSDGTSMTATSGSASTDFALDRNPLTLWRSVGSDDTTTETLVVTLPSSTTVITRILLLNHNFKQFTIKYNDSAVWTDFANVTGIDGDTATISETTFAHDTAYYEVDSVTTDSIQITVTKSQVVDDEKYLSQIIVTTELGTLQGFPGIKSIDHDRNERTKTMISGKKLIIKSEESFSTKLSFKNYPPSFAADLDLMITLFERDTNFLMWLCGGRYDTSVHFRYVIRGFRLRDVKTVQIEKPFKVGYSKNIYIDSINFDVNFEEVVD